MEKKEGLESKDELFELEGDIIIWLRNTTTLNNYIDDTLAMLSEDPTLLPGITDENIWAYIEQLDVVRDWNTRYEHLLDRLVPSTLLEKMRKNMFITYITEHYFFNNSVVTYGRFFKILQGIHRYTTQRMGDYMTRSLGIQHEKVPYLYGGVVDIKGVSVYDPIEMEEVQLEEMLQDSNTILFIANGRYYPSSVTQIERALLYRNLFVPCRYRVTFPTLETVDIHEQYLNINIGPLGIDNLIPIELVDDILNKVVIDGTRIFQLDRYERIPYLAHIHNVTTVTDEDDGTPYDMFLNPVNLVSGKHCEEGDSGGVWTRVSAIREVTK